MWAACVQPSVSSSWYSVASRSARFESRGGLLLVAHHREDPAPHHHAPCVRADQAEPAADRRVVDPQRYRLLGQRQSVAQPPSHEPRVHRHGQARHAQAGVVDLAGQAQRLLAELHVLLHVAGQATHRRVHHGDHQQAHAVAASQRELAAGLVVRGGLLLGDAQSPAVVQTAHARAERKGRDVARLGQALEQVGDLAPVADRLGDVAEAHPRGGARAPARGGERIAGALPVLGDERRALVERVGVQLLDRLGDAAVNGRATLAQLGSIRDLLG